MGPELCVVVVLLFCIFWIYQFVQLMLLSELDFPGKYDKCLWTGAFIFAFFLAPFAFFGWKFAYRAMLARQAELKKHEA